MNLNQELLNLSIKKLSLEKQLAVFNRFKLLSCFMLGLRLLIVRKQCFIESVFCFLFA